MPRRMRALAAGTACVALSLSLAACDSEVRSENAAAGDEVRFQVDGQWPQPFPANWVPGDVTGIAVDGRDHAWVLTPPDSLTTEERAAGGDDPIRLPTVVELDQAGRVVQTWPVPTGELAWPVTPHGIFVDHTDHVWVGYRDDHRVVKFTRAGEHVLTIGEKGVTLGSNDPEHLGAPAGIWVDPETNEVYVADGYRNRRVVVYDGATGAYLRHWGAYGERPDDSYVFDPEVEGNAPARQFSTAHGITGSRDGNIYLADRRNGRVQVFRHGGEFIEEQILPPTQDATASIYDVALSHDSEQRLLFVADGNGKVWVLRRDGLEVLGEIGSPGREPGQFTTPHNLAMDSRGYLHVADAQGRRVQRFRPGG